MLPSNISRRQCCVIVRPYDHHVPPPITADHIWHYNDVIMSTMASQITSLSIVYSTVYTGADQRKHQSSALLAFVWGIHRGPPRPTANYCRSYLTLQWRHNEHDGISNHQPLHCLLNRLYGRRSKKTSKLRVTGLCVGNSPRTTTSHRQLLQIIFDITMTS